MKMITVCLILALLGGTTARAQEVDCSGVEHPKMVFFANGMHNTPEDAERSRRELEESYFSYLETVENVSDEEQCVQFKRAYNQKEEAIVELLETALQSIPDQLTKFWKMQMGILLVVIPDWYKEAYIRIAQEFSSQVAYLIDEDLQTQLEGYGDAPGDYVIVAHSQGNYYATQTNILLGDVPTLAIATPESTLSSQDPFSPYLTFEQDAVINAVRLLTGALEANAQGNCEDDWSCHYMRQAYLHTLGTDMGEIVHDMLFPHAPPLPTF